MQRQLIAPVPGGQSKLEALLADEIRCLATGDLGALAWRELPPPPSRRATLRLQAISAARAITVAVLSFAAVLIVQPFLHASPACSAGPASRLGRVRRKVLTVGLPAVLAGLNDAGAHRLWAVAQGRLASCVRVGP
jgi:hypothetical protein